MLFAQHRPVARFPPTLAGRIVYAWVLTIPMAAAIGALSYGILHAINR